MLNGGYGAFTNEWYRFFHNNIAESFTLGGQLSIKTVAEFTNKRMNEYLGTSDVDYIVAIDTDSVVGDTIIDIDGQKMTIASFFDMQDSYIKNDKFNEDYVKKVTNANALTLTDEGKVEYRPITHVMKHKVKKRMFRISSNGKNVIVTEDHSICVKRGDEIISVKPTQMRKSDKIISINN